MSTIEQKEIIDFKKKGKEALESKKFDEAIEYYTKALESEEDPIVYSNRALAFNLSNKLEEALRDAEKAISMKPTWSEGYYRKGEALKRLNKLEEAKEVLEKAHELDPENEMIKKSLDSLRSTLNPKKTSQSDDPVIVERELPAWRHGKVSSRFERSSNTEAKCEYVANSGQRLEICMGDLTNEKVDAIVNAANNHLMLGGGVAGAIERAGGPIIQKECDLWTEKYGQVENGQCAFTSGGNMHCKYVIHAVGPIWHDGHRNEDKELLYAVYNSFIMGHRLKCTSLSVPAISSGIFGFPKDRCAKIMFHAALQFFKNYPDSTLRLIRFTNFDTPTVNTFVKEFKSRFGTTKAKESEIKSDEKMEVEELKEEKKEEK